MSRSYAAMLPSSLTRVAPCASVCSTSPPVSVCGTVVGGSSLRGFSWPSLRPLLALRPALARSAPEPDLPGPFLAPRAWHLLFHPEAGPRDGVPSSLPPAGTGLLTGCPSPPPDGCGLGPTHPTRIDLPSETWGLRRMRFSRMSSLLMPAFSLV